MVNEVIVLGEGPVSWCKEDGIDEDAELGGGRSRSSTMRSSSSNVSSNGEVCGW